MDQSLQQLIYRLGAYLVLAAINGCALVFIAGLLGDKKLRHDGRAGLNVFSHVDMLGALCAMLYGPGWIRPLDVEARDLRGGAVSLAGIALAGSLVVAFALMVLRAALPLGLPLLGDSAAQVLFTFVRTFAELALWFAIFNLAPLPMLAGEHFLRAIFPRNVETIRRLRLPVAAALLIACACGAHRMLLGGIVDTLAASLWR